MHGFHLSRQPIAPLLANSHCSTLVTVSAVVAFYGSLELAKRLSTQHAAQLTIPAGHVPILGNAWRAAARCALITMQRVGKYNPPPTHEKDVAELKELTTELANVVEVKKWPRVERDDAKVS